jgi:hypothetical protein
MDKMTCQVKVILEQVSQGTLNLSLNLSSAGQKPWKDPAGPASEGTGQALQPEGTPFHPFPAPSG